METATTESVESETTACPLCGELHSTPYRSGFDLRYGVPGEFHIVRCVNCRHRYLNPRPTFDGIRKYYPTEYAPHRLDVSADHESDANSEPSGLKLGLRRVPGLRRFVHWLTQSRAEYLPPVSESPKRALEIGCSDGRFLQRLADANWEVHGVELSEAASRSARERGLDIHVGTLESAGYHESSFDAVFAWMVIEHLHDPVSTLKEIRRILKPSSWFVFSVPNAGCWESRLFGHYWHAYDLPRHLQHFTVKTVGRLIEASGFETVRIIHQRNVYNITGSLGLFFRQKFPKRLGETLLRFTDNPSIGGILLLSPLAKLLAWIRQGGMLTVVVRPKLSETAGANHRR